MYYLSIPDEIVQRLRAPMFDLSEEAVKTRLNDVFGKNWRTESTHEPLFALSIPLVGPRGMEVQTSIPLWITKNTIYFDVGSGEETFRSSYVISAVFDEESKADNEHLAFLNTALRVMDLGMADASQKLSLEKSLLGRRMFLSDRIEDFVVDEKAVKVVMETEKPSQRRSEAADVQTFSAVPAVVNIDRQLTETEFFLLDFSSGGFRIVSAFDFPENKSFNITVKADEQITLLCEVVWKKEIWRGLYHAEIKFMRLHLEKFEKLCRYVETFLPSREDSSIRVNRVFPAEFMLWDAPKKLPAFINSVSENKMSLIFPAFLKAGIYFKGLIYVFAKQKPMEAEFKVEFSRVLKGGGCQSVLSIVSMDDLSREKMNSLIQYYIMEARRGK